MSILLLQMEKSCGVLFVAFFSVLELVWVFFSVYMLRGYAVQIH